MLTINEMTALSQQTENINKIKNSIKRTKKFIVEK